MKYLYPRKYLQVKNTRYLMEWVDSLKLVDDTLEFNYQGNPIEITEVTPSDLSFVELVSTEDSLLALVDQ